MDDDAEWLREIAHNSEASAYTRLRAIADRIEKLTAERDRLRAIIEAPGGCCNCGDADPFRVGKWGMSTADEFSKSTRSSEKDGLRNDKVGG